MHLYHIFCQQLHNYCTKSQNTSAHEAQENSFYLIFENYNPHDVGGGGGAGGRVRFRGLIPVSAPRPR